MECHYPGDDILYFLMPLVGNPNSNVVQFMGKLPRKVIKIDGYLYLPLIHDPRGPT
jgi:hypothetical protein